MKNSEQRTKAGVRAKSAAKSLVVKNNLPTKPSAKKPKLREKIARKLPARRKNLPNLSDETLDEYREKIIAGGRKFKYPLQTSRHRILLVSLAAAGAALVAFGAFLWFMLYPAQRYDDIYYSATRVLPLAVANVDGEDARYSDYLVRLRADVFYYESQERKNFAGGDGKNELNYIKRKDLDATERIAFAEKLARARKISVSDREVDDKISASLALGGSDKTSLARTLKTYYGWSLDEYRSVVRGQLLEQKVAFAVDKSAKENVAKLERALKNGENWDDLAKKYVGGKTEDAAQVADSNSEISRALAGLKPGATATIQTKDLDGNYVYQVAKLISRDKSGAKYSSIQIRANALASRFSRVKTENKIHEFITIPRVQK